MSISKIDILDLINRIRDYEPALVNKIFDFIFIFIPCREDREGNHKYIRAIPASKTKKNYNLIYPVFFFNPFQLDIIIIFIYKKILFYV